MGRSNSNEPQGAFGKDKLFGNRLDQEFAIGEKMILLAGRIADEVIETELGPANPARLLAQHVNEQGLGVGQPVVVTTLASAIVDKVKALQPGELPALVELRKVQSSKFKTEALVLQYVGGTGSTDELAAEFGLDAGELARTIDQSAAVPSGLPGDF